MTEQFISEQIIPVLESIDTGTMAKGEPGFPHRFKRREVENSVEEILE